MAQVTAISHPDVVHHGEGWISPITAVLGAAVIVATIERDTVPPLVGDLLDLLASACFRFLGEEGDDCDDVESWADRVCGEGSIDAAYAWYASNSRRLIRTGLVCDVSGARCTPDVP